MITPARLGRANRDLRDTLGGKSAARQPASCGAGATNEEWNLKSIYK
jgi:hypothetical protein